MDEPKKMPQFIERPEQNSSSFRSSKRQDTQLSFDFPILKNGDPNQRKIHLDVLPHRRGVPLKGIEKETPSLVRILTDRK